MEYRILLQELYLLRPNNFLYLYNICTHFSECYITKRYSSVSLVFNDCLLRQSYTAFWISAYHAHFK